jgi:hypothetical protein
VGRQQFSGAKKAGVENTACLNRKGKMLDGLDVGLGFAETENAITRFPLAALLEEIDALEALQDVALDHDAAGTLETFVL